MKIGRVSFVIAAACLLLFLIGGLVNAQGSANQFDLAIAAIDAQPATASIGDEVTIFVTYENLLPTALPEDMPFDLVVTITDAVSREVVDQCRREVDFSALGSTEPDYQVTVPVCKITLQNPNTYLLRAEFVKAGDSIPEGPYSILPGDSDGSNNGQLSTIIPAAAVQPGALPGDIARIFAGLAIFFAVMALVAVGTEVVIDSLKVGVGLKRKVTSMEALERMEKYLPGELAVLSVSAASREQFKRMMQEMRKTLTSTLQCVSDDSALRRQVGESEFGEAYRQAEGLLLDNGDISQQNLYKVKKQLFNFTNQVSNLLENQLHARSDLVQPLRDQLAQEVSIFDGQNPQEFLKELFETLQDIHFWSVQIADGWLEEQQEVLFDRSSTAVLSHFDSDVRPILIGVGFTSESIKQVENELASRLRIVETGVSQTTDTFVSSVRNVLDAVEMRRFETQSPSRKLWRILRSWRGGLFPPANARGMLIPSVVFAFLALYFVWLFGLSSPSSALTGIIANLLPGIANLSWLPWFLLFFAAAFVFVLILTLIWKSMDKDYPWFVGIYGTTALSLIIAFFVVAVIWILQPDSSSRVSGQLDLLTFIQPWWSWLTIFAVIFLIMFLVVGQIGKIVFERLVRSAVEGGQIADDRHQLNWATTLHKVETLWNLLRHGFDITEVDPESFKLPESISSYEKLSQLTGQKDFQFSAETTAQFIMQRTDQQRDEETSRLRILRVISIMIGLILAYVLQIDVLKLLSEAFPGVLENLNLVVITGDALHQWRSWLPPEKAITVGIILTGFAASAGSAFWHDRLDKLQAAKKGAQAAATLLSQASQVANSIEENS